MKREMVMGRHCIEEVLKGAPERLLKVFTCQKGDDELYRALVERSIPVKEVPKGELTKMVQSESHQSYVAFVKEREGVNLNEFFRESAQKERSVVLMLDSIYDPQNLGALIRAAECFGVDLVVYSKNRGADITPVAAKTSAGATELVPIMSVSNLAETLKQFQKEEFWAVACEAREGSVEVDGFAFPEKVVVILGSEGKGIQPLLSKRSDFHIKIPMRGQIDSLNVSQAAAVILSRVRSQG